MQVFRVVRHGLVCQEKDLRVVLKHLRASGSVASIGLWGRSMGAATAILCAED